MNEQTRKHCDSLIHFQSFVSCYGVPLVSVDDGRLSCRLLTDIHTIMAPSANRQCRLRRHHSRCVLSTAVAGVQILLLCSATMPGPTTIAAAGASCKDIEPPRVTCPPILTLFGRSPVLPNVVIYRIPVDDDCPGARIQSQRPEPGTRLWPSKDSYNVTLTAVDQTNKTGSCRWEVSVPEVTKTGFVKAKVRPDTGAVVWTLSTATTSKKRKPRAGYLLGIRIETENQTAVRRNTNGSEMTFYALTHSGRGQRVSNRLRYDPSSAVPRKKRNWGTDQGTANKRNTRRLLWEKPVPFEANETFDVRIVEHQYPIRKAAVTEIRVALILQYFPRPVT
jgi:hypothetical protein